MSRRLCPINEVPREKQGMMSIFSVFTYYEECKCSKKSPQDQLVLSWETFVGFESPRSFILLRMVCRRQFIFVVKALELVRL